MWRNLEDETPPQESSWNSISPGHCLHCHKLFRASREPQWLGEVPVSERPLLRTISCMKYWVYYLRLTNEKLTIFTAHHLDEDYPLTLGLKMRCVAVICRIPKVTAILPSAVLLLSDSNLALGGWFFTHRIPMSARELNKRGGGMLKLSLKPLCPNPSCVSYPIPAFWNW